ncbi:hypothetical protein BH23PAT1_BH23PAT1_2470 [soil metagenome]
MVKIMINTEVLNMHRACLLHSQMDRNLRLIATRHLEEFGLTMMQWLLLEEVCKNSRKGLTMSESADILGVTLPQVTALTNELIKTRMLKQKVSTKDRRSRRLSCTVTGKRTIAKIEANMNHAVNEWLKNIPPEQLSGYMRTVETLAVKPSKT